MLFLNKVLYGLVCLALTWAAYADLKTRRVPRFAGWGILAVGLIFLALDGLWLEAALYLGILVGSSFRGALVPPVLMGIGIVVLANHPASLPMVVGLGLVFLAFSLRWLGGGDVQLAFGLIALARDWQMLLYLFGVYAVVALVLVIRRNGVLGALKRFAWVARHLGSAESDEQAIRVPWAVVAALGGWVYLCWMPGLLWR